MNIFKNEKDFLADLPFEQLRDTTKEFWEQTLAIRKQMGTRSYILSNYLELLFDALCYPLAFDSAEAGFSKLLAFRNNIEDIIKGNAPENHPLYETAKSYIESYPVSYQERTTRHYLYLVGLVDDVFELAAANFIEDEVEAIASKVDMIQVQELYNRISDILGSEEPVERLNRLFKQRFITTPAAFSFLQGFNNDFIFTLATRDNESARRIFHLYMEDLEEWDEKLA